MRTIILKAASRQIPSGRHRINTEPVPAEILEKMRARDDLRSRDPTSPARTTNEHRRNTWRQFVETRDHRTDPSKLWRTIKAIDGKSPPKAENEAITFGDIQVSSPKQIANYFNRQFTTSKLGRHTSALLQLTSDVTTGFNQRKPPHRMVCVAVDLTAAFDTVNHNALLSKIARSTLPEATCRWLSNYIRGRQSVTSSRGVKSKEMIIHTGVPQGSKLSPTLFSFYIADMPRPTEPVKRICYADDITV